MKRLSSRHSNESSDRHTGILLITKQPPRAKVRRLASQAKDRIIGVRSCEAARKALEADPHISRVVTETSLVDGTWCDVLRLIAESGVKAKRLEVLCPSASSRFAFNVAAQKGRHNRGLQVFGIEQ